MLGTTNAIANIAVKDIGIAKSFYEDVLGLQRSGSEGDEMVALESGTTTVFIYVSDTAGSNRATAVSWIVGDRVKSIAEALKARGVPFEHYEMPGMHLEGDVHVGDAMQIAWFRDPEGNILSLVSG